MVEYSISFVNSIFGVKFLMSILINVVGSLSFMSNKYRVLSSCNGDPLKRVSEEVKEI